MNYVRREMWGNERKRVKLEELSPCTFSRIWYHSQNISSLYFRSHNGLRRPVRMCVCVWDGEREKNTERLRSVRGVNQKHWDSGSCVAAWHHFKNQKGSTDRATGKLITDIDPWELKYSNMNLKQKAENQTWADYQWHLQMFQLFKMISLSGVHTVSLNIQPCFRHRHIFSLSRRSCISRARVGKIRPAGPFDTALEVIYKHTQNKEI